MRKLILTSILLLSLCFNSFSQDSTSSYVGINFPQIFGNTIDLGYELNINSFWSFDAYGGYTFNSKIHGSCDKEYTGLKIQNKSGGFIKMELDLIGEKN